MFVIGLAAGAASRWLDLNTQNLGNMFSQLPVWILIGVFVTLESENRLCACLNVLSLCIAMLITYYYVMLKAIPHKDCTYIAQSDFLSYRPNLSQEY